MYSDLDDFLADLDRRRLLARIGEPVNPDLEIAAVTDRACKSPGGGPALLFEKPTGFTIPVASNVFGSMERMCLALGVEALDDLAREIDELMAPQMPKGVLDALKMLPLVGRLGDLLPKTVKDAPCQEVVRHDGALDELPILKSWPEDGGRFVGGDPKAPASAHPCLEACVEPGERPREGPFGDHPVFYSQPDEYPVFHRPCLTQRERPTYLTTIVGIPPMEDYYLGLASERIFLPMIRKTVPEIVDMHFPAEGIFHNLVIVSIDKRYPGHARKIMHAFWGLGQLMFSKTIVVVDKDVDVHDLSEVAWIVGTHMDPLRDVQMTRGPVDDLDDAAELPAYGGKVGIDATRKWASEGYTRRWPERIATTEAAGRKAADILRRLRKSD